MSAKDSLPLQVPYLAVKDVSALVEINRLSDYQYQEAGFGGSADIFCGTYRQKDGKSIKVAIKSIRANEFDGQDPEYEQKMRKKLYRELEIWHKLGNGSNIIELLGIVIGVGPLPSPVCELCTWNLKSYLERKTPPPKHMQMMTDTLRGLSYMHELRPAPIAHGDIKSHNILVTENEKAIICDFGRSRSPQDQPQEDSRSSPFGATLRYMSPELFASSMAGPTPASDMWAYGCVALEILCRVQPYQEVINDYEAVELIRLGRTPSDRPRGARATLINDTMWSTLASCWREKNWRPTSRELLEKLIQMLQTGEASASPVVLDLFPVIVDGPLEQWPEEIFELNQLVAIHGEGRTSESSIRSHVWRATLTSTRWATDTETEVVIKVPRLNVSPQHREPHDHLQQILRKTVKTRYGIRHRNIINILGIDSSFSPHPGIVLECCAGGNLTVYCKTHALDTDATARPSSPSTNAYNLLSDILEGLKYMHNYPVPIPQGDLTPDNILITINGVAKIALFSFGRILAAIPSAAALTASVGPILPFRWMSPELLLNNLKPTTESDMWAVGCVGFWILTGLRPYAGHLRDDFAGVDSVRGLPPGSISQIDHANTLGERVVVYRESSWITNGVWRLINKCWAADPLLRPSASSFLSFVKSLEGRIESWMPVGVVDLVGKVKKPEATGNRLWRGRSVWVQYESGRKMFREQVVDMVVLRSTHTPNWYTKQIPVAIKQVFSYTTSLKAVDFRPYVSSIRHEIAIMAQLDHPSIHKLLGIDSSHEEVPSMVFEYFSDMSLYRHLSRSKGIFQDDMNIIKDIVSALAYIHEHPNGTIAHGNISTNEIFVSSEGRAKLTNFSCAFQYIAHHSRGMTPLSSITSAVYGKSRWRCPEYYKDRGENYIPPPTAASDIWSFGCVIVNIFLRELPFFTTDETEYVAQLNGGIAPYSQEQLANLDGRILVVVQDMLARDPKARPSARDVLKNIAAIM